MLSIIVPVYNAEKTINRCIKSIIETEIKFDYEIILINDGSKDKSFSILKKWSQEYKNIYVYDQKNQGVSVARNQGISGATGEWIMFVDADDFLLEDWSAIVEKYINSTYDWIIFNQQEIEGVYNEIETITGVVKGTYMGNPFSKLYKREQIQKYNLLYQENIINGEDALFNLEYYLSCKDVHYVKESIYSYCINGTSATNSFNNKFIKSDMLYQKKLQSILMKLQGKYEYILKINILNAWLVFFDRYSRAKKYDIDNFEMLRNNAIYRETLNQYSKYSKYFSSLKRILLFLLKYKRYKLVYIVYKLKNRLKKGDNEIKIERI